MGHTKPEDLKDLSTELAEVRKLAGIRENSPNVFYIKSKPFLHFHVRDGVRWADVKTIEGGWARLDIDFEASASMRVKFVKSVRLALKAFEK